MSEFVGAIVLILTFAALFYAAKTQRQGEEEDERNDFDYLSVREQIAAAHKTADTIGDLEQLLTDLQQSCEEDITVLHMEWIGRDNEKHEYDLYCNGTDAATECMAAITECEVHDLRGLLAYQCEAISAERHRQIYRQNGTYAIGDEADDEALSALRNVC